MSLELEQPNLFEQFELLIQNEDTLEIREFLNDQNISDVADLINEYPEYEARIVANMAIHRAASVFKILDIAQQKDIVKELPSAKTAAITIFAVPVTEASSRSISAPINPSGASTP